MERGDFYESALFPRSPPRSYLSEAGVLTSPILSGSQQVELRRNRTGLAFHLSPHLCLGTSKVPYSVLILNYYVLYVNHNIAKSQKLHL